MLSNSPTPERAPLMPTRRQLMEAGRHDLVRQIASAGGFLEVAQALGYRSVRKPPGYWEDEDALDRELSLFVAANWIQFEDDSEGDSEGEGDGEGSWLEADDKADFFGQVLGSHAQQEKAQWAGTSDQSAKPRQKEVYWYNQVTRRVQWSEPDVPEFVPLDDEGSVLLTEAPEDRAMPSRRTLLAAGRYDLHAAIMSAGGYTQVAEDLDRWPAWPPTRVRITILQYIAVLHNERISPSTSMPVKGSIYITVTVLEFSSSHRFLVLMSCFFYAAPAWFPCLAICLT